MTLTFHNIKSFLILGLLLSVVFPHNVSAQTSQVLSVTPPLFQIAVDPGDVWQSSVKIVNANPYELTVYADVVNFAPEGENGQGRFLPILNTDESSKISLAEWIEIPNGPYVIPPEQSKNISFFLDVPKDAPPGGHFAAILIGTQPPQDTEGQLAVQTSQTVTSLFFVRIAGDVVELGDIRQFSVADKFVGTPISEFILRFENKGNVHLQPRGDINITNMWGSERGIIPINQHTHFGNVLPDSVREFSFAWTGEAGIAEIGRHKAVVTLGYGDDGIKNVHQTLFFWVIPIKATLITLTIIAIFIYLIIWMVKRYVRRMLTLAGVETQEEYTPVSKQDSETLEIPRSSRISYKSALAPLQSGFYDLRERLSNTNKIFDFIITIGTFVMHYKMFFGSVLILCVGFIGIVYFVADGAKDQKSYEITINNDAQNITVDSETILKEKMASTTNVAPNQEQHFTLHVSNASGEAGLAAFFAQELERKGYVVASVDTADEVRKHSVIIYHNELSDEAVAISTMLDNVLVSGIAKPDSMASSSVAIQQASITLIVGKDKVE